MNALQPADRPWTELLLRLCSLRNLGLIVTNILRYGNDKVRSRFERDAARIESRIDPDIAPVISTEVIRLLLSRRIGSLTGGREQSRIVDRPDEVYVVIVWSRVEFLKRPARSHGSQRHIVVGVLLTVWTRCICYCL